MRHFLSLLLLIVGNSILTGQILSWAGSIGGEGNDVVKDLTIDQHKNIYVTGASGEHPDLDPGPGVFEPSPWNAGTFITKFNARGKLDWGVSFYSHFHTGVSITTDPDGNVYTAGNFSGYFDFDPSWASDGFNGNGHNNSFIVKLNAEGKYVWGKGFKPGNGSNEVTINEIELDAAGNVLATGYFSGSVDFDPGPDTNFITIPYDQDIFLLKLDANGNFLWVKTMRGKHDDQGSKLDFDEEGNIFLTGQFMDTIDMDPGPDSFKLISKGEKDVFVLKLDPQGDFIWALGFGGGRYDLGNDIILHDGNVHLTGNFRDTVDLDPGPGQDIFYTTSPGNIFIMKLDNEGKYLWAKSIGSPGADQGKSLDVDQAGNIYISGFFTQTADFDPGPATHEFISYGYSDGFVAKFDPEGNYLIGFPLKTADVSETPTIKVDDDNFIYTAGNYKVRIDVDPGPGLHEIIKWESYEELFISKYQQKGVVGYVYNDINEDCILNDDEIGLPSRRAMIQPGHIFIETDKYGFWTLDTLPAGIYTITYDLFGNWRTTCPSTSFDFTITDPGDVTLVPSFGLVSTNPCAEPEITVHAPFFRRCFPEQTIHLSACNLDAATGVLLNAYVILELDSLLTPGSSSRPYTDIGDHRFRFDLGNINPGQCIEFWINTTVSCDAVLEQTLCIEANLFPADSCVLSGETLVGPNSPPCAQTYDESHLSVDGFCENGVIKFSVTNSAAAGEGDMQCYSQWRLYVDGQFIMLDSIRLGGNTSDTISLDADGRTWRLEVDQHPLHPGRSRPNATIERCGNDENWRAGFVSVLPDDDANAVTDIFCRTVTGGFDPNDKAGYPSGVGDAHLIGPNGKIDYVIRFQNTGNDTAFNIVIRDTLDADLDMFSIRTGVSSHDFEFKMSGPRVIEWYFYDIMLPDSTTNLARSNGFVTYSIDQNKDLEDGTSIVNSAAIYFDYNDPVITNAVQHTIGRELHSPSWTVTKELTLESCNDIIYNGITYNRSGVYWQVAEGGAQADTFLTLNISLPHDVNESIISDWNSLTTNIPGASFQWMDCDKNLVVPGETDNIFYPASSSNYAVIVDQDGCIDTSACFSFVITASYDADPLRDLVLYPNPVDDHVVIDFGRQIEDAEIIITDVLGKVISQRDVTSGVKSTIDIDETAGLYFIIVRTGHRQVVRRITSNR